MLREGAHARARTHDAVQRVVAAMYQVALGRCTGVADRNQESRQLDDVRSGRISDG